MKGSSVKCNDTEAAAKAPAHFADWVRQRAWRHDKSPIAQKHMGRGL